MAITDKLTAIANAIRAKTGKAAAMTLDEMPTEISGIKSGGGEASLNIAYGDTAPDDTSKLWVKCAEPSKVAVSTDIVTPSATIETPSVILPIGAYGIAAERVGDKIYLFGGYPSSSGYPLATINVFDIKTQTVETLATTLPTRAHSIATASIDTKIYLFGGQTFEDVRTNNILVFDTENQTIEKLATVLPTARSHIGCASVGTKIYLFGGMGYNGMTDGGSSGILIFDTVTQYIEQITTRFPKPSYSIAAEAVGDKIYLFGGGWNEYGFEGSSGTLSTVYEFDTTTNKLTELGITSPGYGVASIASGTKIYLFGGTSSGTRIRVFDAESQTIETLSARIPYSNYYMAAADDGLSVYLFGGSSTYNSKIYRFILQAVLPKDTLQIQTTLFRNNFEIMPSIEMGVKGVYLGNAEGYAEPVETFLNRYVDKTKITKYYTDSCKEITSGTSITSSVKCAVGDLVVAAIATRDTLTVSDGWTLVSTSGINSEDTTGNGQRLSWAYKFAESTTESITVTQATAERLYINMIALQGATGVTDNGYSYRNDTTSGSMTVTKPSGLILWGMTTSLWSTTEPYNLWESSNNIQIIQLGENTQSRLGVGLDHTESESVTFTSGSSATTMIVGSLTVEGIDLFYDEERITGYVWEPIS